MEALTGDFAGDLSQVQRVAQSGLDVYAHNIETVEALTPQVRDRRATFRQSLAVLAHAKASGARVTKTSIMLGVGERDDQVLDALRELRKVDVDVVTFGQYMRPTKRHMKVDRYVEPAEFEKWKEVAEDMGFLYVASGPLVRSSYKVRLYSNSPYDLKLLTELDRPESFILRMCLGARGSRRRQRSWWQRRAFRQIRISQHNECISSHLDVRYSLPTTG